MNLRTCAAAVTAAVLLAGLPALAQQDELIEKVVVRNRLYTLAGRFEVAPTVGFTVVNQLTDHVNLNANLAYNMSDTLAVELRGGYALSRHTGLADQVADKLLQRDPARELTQGDDFSHLWEMKGNGVIGLRWAPLYGKISLLAELPVHAQAYLWAGAGAGQFERQSIVYCANASRPKTSSGAASGPAVCNEYLFETDLKFVGSAAAGFRFFTHQGGGVRAELRNYIFPDAYRIDIDRRAAESGQETGTQTTTAGLTNLVLFDVGYSFIF